MAFLEMPFRRRTFYKRRRSFVPKYRKRRMIKSYLRRKSKKGNLTVTKLRQVYNAAFDSAGSIDFYPHVLDPTGLEDWASYQAIYDSFRVYAVKIKFIPSLPNDTSINTAFRPIYYTFDVDSTSPPNSVSDVIQYENLKVKNLYRPHSVYYRVPRYTSGGQGSAAVLAGGFFDVNTTPPQNGVIGCYAENIDISQNYGTFVVTFYIGFKNRR